jgi:hypothetical protein
VHADEQQMSNYLNVETIDKGTGNGIQLSGYMEERVRSNGKISAFGTPRSVYISVGANPTRQLTVRAVAKEAESLTGGRKQR